MVLIRGNCFKIVIYVYLFKRAGEARACPPPPKKGGVISFDCQNLTVFSKTVKTGGDQPLTINMLLSGSFFFFSWRLWYFTKKFDADHKEELQVKFHDYHIFILTLIIAQNYCWKVIHHFTILNGYSTNNNFIMMHFCSSTLVAIIQLSWTTDPVMMSSPI